MNENMRFIELYVSDALDGPLNIADAAGERWWDAALIGAARGDDPLFERVRSHIGESFYWSPAQGFRLHFGRDERPDGLAVVSIVFLQTAAAITEQARQSRFSGRRWAASRLGGDAALRQIMTGLAAALAGRGIDAFVPSESPHFSQHRIATGPAAVWSERHTAYVCGLGTFGLSGALITERGAALRVYSLIARMDAPAPVRAYSGVYDYCPFKSDAGCGACIDRCPAGAISPEGRDNAKCEAYIMGAIRPHSRERFGLDSYGCGLCQTGVPCASCRP